MVNDMDKGISFYESIGMSLKQRWDNHYAMLTAPGLTIGLHPTEDKNPNSGTLSIGFMIDSIDEAKALLDKNNILHDDEVLWLFRNKNRKLCHLAILFLQILGLKAIYKQASDHL